MKHQVKYIIIKQNHLEIPIIFPDVVFHSEMARNHRTVSAGFCTFDEFLDHKNDFPKIKVYGGSESLRMNSRQEDADIIMRYLELE